MKSVILLTVEVDTDNESTANECANAVYDVVSAAFGLADHSTLVQFDYDVVENDSDVVNRIYRALSARE